MLHYYSSEPTMRTMKMKKKTESTALVQNECAQDYQEHKSATCILS